MNEESATRKVFRSRILGVDDYINCEIVTPDNQLALRVADQAGAIGQLSMSFLKESSKLVDVLSVNGESASVTNQNYPITRPLYLLWWPERPQIADFVNWIQTPEAQKIITRRFIGKIQESNQQKGKLVVYSKTIPYEEGGTYYYYHEPYEIYSKEGKLIQSISNS